MEFPNTFKCSFCNSNMTLTDDTHYINALSFHNSFSNGAYEYNLFKERLKELKFNENFEDSIVVEFFKCPNCSETSIKISGFSQNFEDRNFFFNPLSNARQFPDYIPRSIREDYEEAYAIVNLSPKASATLTRRCLQSILRDYWEVKPKKLYNEITEIEDRVEPSVKKVLDSLRQLGNIGAHPEKDLKIIVDIEPGEAEKMLKIVEYLIEQWYIKDYETKQLLEEVNKISETKKNLKKS